MDVHNVEHTESPHPLEVGPPRYANIPNGQSSYSKIHMPKNGGNFQKKSMARNKQNKKVGVALMEMAEQIFNIRRFRVAGSIYIKPSNGRKTMVEVDSRRRRSMENIMGKEI